MKRTTFALLLHPYKNALLPQEVLRNSIGTFLSSIFTIYQSYPQLRLNIVLPGYLLECADPLLLGQLRELCKKNVIEMICTGYTEPFLSLSPPELTVANIRHGLQLTEELIGYTPKGYLPPFSNWEPSFIPSLRSMGFRYALLSNELFSPETQNACGYWVAEHTGDSIGLIGTRLLDGNEAPPDIYTTLKASFADNTTAISDPFVTLHYLLPLSPDKQEQALTFLQKSVENIDKHLLTYQPVCLGEPLGATNPIGLQYIPTGLQLGRMGKVALHFLNHLFSFDQIGFLQRKLLDTYVRMTRLPDQRSVAPLMNGFYRVQDINRFLPGSDSGIEVPPDRATTYRHLIALDAKIRSLSKVTEGRVRVTDFLRNGGKTIQLSNERIKTYIDYNHGGQLIGFDLRKKMVNLCSVYNPERYNVPDIVVSGSTRTWFYDSIIIPGGSEQETSTHLAEDSSDFNNSAFDYKVHKNPSGINVSLVHTGSFQNGDRQCPLTMEKVFGLDKDKASLSFVYQFSNPSLMEYDFLFTTELFLFLPGITAHGAILTTQNKTYEALGTVLLRIPQITNWSIDDSSSGIRLQFQLQKQSTLWCLPLADNDQPTQGLRIVISHPVKLASASPVKFFGKILFKTIKTKGEVPNAL